MRRRYRHSTPWSSLADAWSRLSPTPFFDIITLRDDHSRNHGRLPARDPIYRALLIAAGYPDGNDCDALRTDPAFKMAVGRLPESGADLCSQPTISRLANLPGPVALKRMMAAMVELFCDSFEQVPRRIVLDIDDTEDRVSRRAATGTVQRLLRQ